MLQGTGSTSLRKTDPSNQKVPASGVKRLVFNHKASAGATGINLSSLTIPPEMSALGFTNPSASDLANLNLLFNRANLTLISSRGVVFQDYFHYTMASSTQINFNGWVALEGEIFTGVIQVLTNGARVVDASPIVATGVLTAGATDFNVGTPFELGKYSTAQVGAVLVFDGGAQLFRNTGNQASPSDGNYYELSAGAGLGSVIRFNTATAYDRNILVVSNGLLAERPDGSMMALIEAINGKLNNVAIYAALATGQSVTTVLGAAATNVDLKAFGDLVARKAFLDVSNTWTAYQALPGRTDGSSPAAGIFGEKIAATLTTQTVQTTANVEKDILSATLPLTPGNYVIYFDSLISLNNGSTQQNVALRVRMTDASNNFVPGSNALIQGINIPASTSYYNTVQKSFPLTVTSAQTYKLRMTGDKTPGSGAGQCDCIFRSNSDVGAFSGTANDANFFAIRVG